MAPTIKFKGDYRLQKVPAINRPHLANAKYMVQKWNGTHYDNVQGFKSRLVAEVYLLKLK